MSQRNWEIDLIQNEWPNGNSTIFRTDVTDRDIEDAVSSLHQQNTEDQQGEDGRYDLQRNKTFYNI